MTRAARPHLEREGEPRMSFDRVYKQTKEFEGGYVDDPLDAGGETFRGISRKNHPKWPGWPLISQAKADGRLAGAAGAAALARFIDERFRGDAAMERLV
ncbi:MAG: hypothetical protein FWG97_03875 [Deltaproteobacteria bacterium]|nr:hypothetical protein [Deltaproteobacteria bacterium]